MTQAEDVLAHYGVLGMKWGKRKGAEPRVVVSKEDKALAKKNFKTYSDPVLATRIRQMSGDSAMSETRYSQLNTKDVNFRKGKELARITTRKDEAFRDSTYVSYLQDDRVRYRAVMKDTHVIPKKQYEAIYKSTQALKGPSEKARVDAFVDLMDTKSVPWGKKTITGREYLTKAGYGRDVRSLDSHKLGLKYYQEHSAALVSGKSPMASAYFKQIRDKGYNMLGDDQDAGVISKAPLIILDPSSNIKRMSVRPLTAQDVVDARINIKPVQS